MLHRLLHDVLTAGIATITADIAILEELFRDHYEIEATETAAFRTYFEANGFNVINGYARRDTVFPAVSIVLASEGESQSIMGDDAGPVYDVGDPNIDEDILAAFWEHTYHLYVCTDHPDMTAGYYELVKTILLAGLDTFDNDGCFQYHFNGADLAPDPRYMPEHLFVRQFTFKCAREFQRIDHGSKAFKAFAVSGIHVDSSGSPSEVGDVKTLVTPYTEE